jgi:hypothetical protein
MKRLIPIVLACLAITVHAARRGSLNSNSEVVTPAELAISNAVLQAEIDANTAALANAVQDADASDTTTSITNLTVELGDSNTTHAQMQSGTNRLILSQFGNVLQGDPLIVPAATATTHALNQDSADALYAPLATTPTIADVAATNAVQDAAIAALGTAGESSFGAELAEYAILSNTNLSRLWILYGQSNAQGQSKEYTPYSNDIDGVYKSYQAGTYSQMTWDLSSDQWGSELQFSQRLSDTIGGTNIILKRFLGGTAIDGGFLPGQASYTSLTTEVAFLETQFDFDGIAGVVWIQGETPSATYDTRSEYAEAEASIRDGLRGLYGSNMIWVTCGLGGPLAGDYDRADYRNLAKQDLAEADPLTRYVDLFDVVGSGYTDVGVAGTGNEVHYSAEGLVDVGNRTFEAMFAATPNVSASRIGTFDELYVDKNITLTRGNIILADGSQVGGTADTRVSQEDCAFYFDFENKSMPDRWGGQTAGGTPGDWLYDADMGGTMEFVRANTNRISLTIGGGENFTVAGIFEVDLSTSSNQLLSNNDNSGFWIRWLNYNCRLYVDGAYLPDSSGIGYVVDDTPFFLSVRHTDAGVWTIDIDSETYTYTNATETLSLDSTLWIGSAESLNTANLFGGKLGELVYFDRTLSDEETADIKSAFANRTDAIYGAE